MAKRQKKAGCEKCYSAGFLVDGKDSRAVAELCNCMRDCKNCNGSGVVVASNKRGYSYASPCSYCGLIRRNVRLYNAAGIPAKYAHVRQIDAALDVKKTSHLQSALKYAREEFVKKYPTKRGFLLMGLPGLGKTHLAIGTISELTLNRGVRCIFKDFSHLLSDLKQAYSEGASENEVIMPLVETEVLVVDELGRGKSSDWELNVLDQLISKRYNTSKRTLITTNCVSYDIAKDSDTLNEILENKVGERIASRLYEMCEFLYLKGGDHRRTQHPAS